MVPNTLIRRALRRIRQSPRGTAALGMLVLIVATFTLGDSPLSKGCVAATHNIDGMCYRTPLRVSRIATSTLSNYPIGFTVNPSQLLDQGVLGTYGWDALPVNPGNAEIQGLLQDLNTTATSTAWWVFGDVTGGDGTNAVTTTFNLYSGNATQKRDQGMGFSIACGDLAGPCFDRLTITDTASHRFTNDFDLIVDAQTSPASSAQSADLVNKLSANTGYRLGLNTSGQLEAQVGDGATTFTATTTWDGTNQRIRMCFDAKAASDLTIAFFNDTTEVYDTQVSANSTFASLGTSTTDVLVGDALTVTIFEVELNNNVGASTYGRVSHLGFNPVDVAQTQVGNAGNIWTWRGTVNDLQSGTNHVNPYLAAPLV